MKKLQLFLLCFVSIIAFNCSSIKSYAWGGDVIVSYNTDYEFSESKIAVGFDGTIYCAQIIKSDSGNYYSFIYYSTDNGQTFTFYCSSGWYPTSKLTAIDLITAGNDSASFALFIAKGYLDTVSGKTLIDLNKYDINGNPTDLITETHTYSTMRGWESICLATDSREKNLWASPYSISMVASKAGNKDSIIIWTDNDGGTALNRRALMGTSNYIRNVSASIGSTNSITSKYGRLGIVWDEYEYSDSEWGTINFQFIFPDDATNPTYTGPYTIGTNNVRNPSIALSQDTAGGSGYGDNDIRVMLLYEYQVSNVIYSLVIDSIIKQLPTLTKTCWISANTTAGENMYPHCIYDPKFDNFLITYFNTNNNTLPYLVKPISTAPTDIPITISSNYRDDSSACTKPILPRVEMYMNMGQAVFVWNDKNFSMFDAEYSDNSIKEVVSPGLNDLIIYPNPATDVVNFDFNIEESQQFAIIITDITGREVLTETHFVTAGNNKIAVPINHLISGNYFVMLKGKTSISNSMLIVVQ